MYSVVCTLSKSEKSITPPGDKTGFMNCDILKAKRNMRRAWRRENSASNRSRYRAAINHYNFLLEKSKCNHYSNIVAENQGNPKALWNCFKKILHRSSVAVLPDYTNKTDLANTFCKFFYDKILKIRSTLQSSIPSSVTRPNSTKNTLSSFKPVSEEELLKILKSSPSKSCDLDPIPTSLVKECVDILITPITKIVNYSITEGSFPNCFKMAYVTPLQKKPSLDRNILKNYRPVSNLSFISKLIEKVVAKQLNEFISHEGLLNVNQSAYKSSHSTETALLKIQNDIALSVDSGKGSGPNIIRPIGSV